MILRDVLKYAVLYLGYADTIDLDDRQTNEDNSKELKTLVRCANLVYHELLSDYLPIFKKEKICFDKGFFPYTNLEEQILNIYSLKAFGEEVVYKTDATGIYCDEKQAEITYGILRDNLKLDSYIDIDGRITPKIFSLGVASEFCLINNLYEENLTFEKKYKESLKELLRKKSEIRVKSRGWY